MIRQTMFLFLTFLGLNLLAAETIVKSTVNNVVIYHSGALVQRSAKVSLAPGSNELTFNNVSAKIVLNSLKISNPEITILNKTIVQKLTDEQFNRLTDRKEALTKEMGLIESKFEEVGFISEVEDLEKMAAFYSRKMLELKRNLRDVEHKITEAKKLENVNLENENAAILKLIVTVSSTFSQTLNLQYVCGGIGWSPAYDVSVENAAGTSLELKYYAKVMSQTGEDWDNVTVQLSSSFPLERSTSLPVATEPWILVNGSVYTDQRFDKDKAGLLEMEITLPKNLMELEGVSYEQINVPQFLDLKKLEGKFSLKSNSTVFNFPISSSAIPASFHYYAYPSLDPETYLVAEMTDWEGKGFVDGKANISFRGNEVGNTMIHFSNSIDTLTLPIGKDNGVYMNRAEIANQKYFKVASVGKKKKLTMAYEFSLKNNNTFPIEIDLMDQIPISQSKSASVEIEEKTDGIVDYEQGEVMWELTLAPGESVKKVLIYTIDMDANFSYSPSKQKSKYKAVKSPRFL